MSAVDSNTSTELQTKEPVKHSSDPAHISASENVPSPSNNGAESFVDKEEQKRYFDDSTHSFFIYFLEDPKGKRNISGLIVALFVIAMQTGLYGVCSWDIFGKLIQDDEYTIPVTVLYGRGCQEPSHLKCPPELQEWHHAGLAAVLLAFFMMHDIIATIKLMVTVEGKFAKFAAFVIFLEALFGTVVACMFALEAKNGYDAVVNCIGILFIHDVDEKAFQAFNVVEITDKCKAKCKCCKVFGRTELSALFVVTFVLFVAVFVAGSAIRDSDIDLAKESYSPEWYEKNFGGDGIYSYGWADDSDYSFADNYQTATGTATGTATPGEPTKAIGSFGTGSNWDPAFEPTWEPSRDNSRG